MQKRKVASLAFTGVAGTGMVAFGAAPAFAAGGVWKVSAPAGTPYHGAYTAGTTKATLGAAITLTCTSATAKGSIPATTGNSSTNFVGTITSATFKNCTGFGATLNAHLKKTAYLWVNQPTSTGGKTKGFIAGQTGKAANAISASLSGSTFGGGCHATVTGSSIPGSYSNTNHKLNINPGHAKTLTIKNPTGCTGIANGSKAFFSAAYTVKTPTGLVVHNT